MSQILTFDGSYAYGIVENVKDDPKKLNRVQVRLFAIHDQDKSTLPTENLPWCQVLLPTTSNEASSHGIKVGMCVKCSFLDGIEMQIPVVEGVLPGVVVEGKSATGNDDKTLSKYADNRNITKKAKLDPSQPEDPYKAKYPDNWVFETPTGHRIEIDDTEGSERIHIFHKSGSNTEFHPDGSVVTAVTKDEFIVVSGKSTTVVKKDQTVKVEGEQDVTVDGDASLSVKGSLKAIVAGEATIEAEKATVTTSGDVTATAGGNITLQGSGNVTVRAGGVLVLSGSQVMIG